MPYIEILDDDGRRHFEYVSQDVLDEVVPTLLVCDFVDSLGINQDSVVVVSISEE